MKCKYCNSERLQKIGFIPTIKGKKQRYRCSECGHTFYGDSYVL